MLTYNANLINDLAHNGSPLTRLQFNGAQVWPNIPVMLSYAYSNGQLILYEIDNRCHTCGGSGALVETCDTCNGYGYITDSTTCPECDGSGWIDTDGSSAICPTCDGNGVIEVNETCTECDGSGYIVNPGACPECDGSGIGNYGAYDDYSFNNQTGTMEIYNSGSGSGDTYETCPECGGVGTLEVTETCSQCDGSGTVDGSECPLCHGMGWTSSTATCPTCDGSGVIIIEDEEETGE